MSDPQQRHMLVDDRLEVYRTIFNHAWAKQLLEMVDGTKLDSPFFELSINWRAAVNTHAFPWMMMNSMASLWESHIQERGFTPRFVSVMAKEIPRRMGGKMTNMARKRLAQVLQDVTDEIHKNIENEPDAKLDANDMWRYFQGDEAWELRVAIWGSQRFCFGALYHAFENYCREVLAIKKGDPHYRFRTFQQLIDHTTAEFGQVVADKCLNDDFLDVARMVRNALAHNGGKETKEMIEYCRTKPHGFTVTDGVLQITAPFNERLISALESRVSLLTGEALKHQEFK